MAATYSHVASSASYAPVAVTVDYSSAPIVDSGSVSQGAAMVSPQPTGEVAAGQAAMHYGTAPGVAGGAIHSYPPAAYGYNSATVGSAAYGGVPADMAGANVAQAPVNPTSAVAMQPVAGYGPVSHGMAYGGMPVSAAGVVMPPSGMIGSPLPATAYYDHYTLSPRKIRSMKVGGSGDAKATLG